MQLKEQVQIRKQRGYEIAKIGKVIRESNMWSVPSQTSNKNYEVTLFLDRNGCTCPDYIERKMTCRHIRVVGVTVSRKLDGQGNVLLIQTKRITYPQDWFTDFVRSKNLTAQLNEILLKVLCHNIRVVIQEMFELGIEPNFLRD
jgi:hypothetical protein